MIGLTKQWATGLVLLIVVGFGAPWGAHTLAQPALLAPRYTASSSLEPAKILVSKQSHYQKIVLTEEVGSNPFFPDSKEHVLYLDGFLQFNSLHEQAYHACIANIPMSAAEYVGTPARDALILGGGGWLSRPKPTQHS